MARTRHARPDRSPYVFTTFDCCTSQSLNCGNQFPVNTSGDLFNINSGHVFFDRQA